MKQANVRQFFSQFPDDGACVQHLFDVRFGQGHECPKCKRAAKWYRLKSELAFSRQWCGNHIHPMVGSIFEKSSTPLQLWFYAMFLFTTSRHGVSGKELQRQFGVTYKTAWRMCQMIRLHMAGVAGEEPIGGWGKHAEIDVTMVGGVRKGKRGRGAEGKTVVLGMLERGGDLITEVVPDARRATLLPIIEAHVEIQTDVHTDELKSYDNLPASGHYHKRGNHSAGEYFGFDGASVNAFENFWRHLKCSIQGTHISVWPKNLERYAKEFEYRFNRRIRPETMLSELLSRFPELDV